MTTRAFGEVLLAILGIWWLVEGVIQFASLLGIVIFSDFEPGGGVEWFDLYGTLLVSSFGSLAIGAVVLRFRESIARRLIPAAGAESAGATGGGEPAAPSSFPLDAGSALSIGIFCIGVWLMATSLGPLVDAARGFDADLPGSGGMLLVQTVPFAAGVLLALLNRGVLRFLGNAPRVAP